jgi:hypothetical protein
MKRFVSVLALVAAMAFSLNAAAKDMKMGGKPVTLKGEIVDTGCYMAHEARGEKHKECGAKCVANGMPMGLLTSDNKLYLITLDHDNGDPYAKCKALVDAMVEVTGTVSERGGMRSINVADVKPMATASK